MKYLIVVLFALNGLYFPEYASAQVTISLPEAVGRNRLSLGIALQPELTTSLAYTRVLNPANDRMKFSVGAGITFLPLLLGSGNWRTQVITAANWHPGRQWGATFSTQFYLAQAHNRASLMDGLGVEARVIPSHYGSHWTTGLDLGWQSTLLTHIKQLEATRETFRNRYPGRTDDTGPVDGWYGSTAHRFRIGLVGARRLFGPIALQIAAGSLFSLQKQGVAFSFSHAQVPLYAETLLRAQW
jgi:hypothetical protein